MKAKPFVAINIVPTGIAASIGGYAGDAGPANRLIASCVDLLIANPNVVNAAIMHNIPSNMLYTEGYTLDSFCKGNIALRQKKFNKIGVVFDRGIPEEVINMHINAINACKSVYGINIPEYLVTDKPVNVEYYLTDDGYSTGAPQNTQTLLEASQALIKKGIEALAVVCFFPDYEGEDLYSKGQCADPAGGAEAIISHIVSQEFSIPCAHAPAFSIKESMPSFEIVDPRAAAEYISPVFLPSVIAGLNQAPAIIDIQDKTAFDLTIDDACVIVTPCDCLGSVPVLSFIERNKTVLAVRENMTVFDVTAENLKITGKIKSVDSYLEACKHIIIMHASAKP
jgi:hypothetical protein